VKYIDVFNGDADGICALVQLYLEQPRQAELVTGVKRDINLLSQVKADKNNHVTVLDISFEKNINDIKRLLNNGASIDYIDHHKTGELITHENLQLSINLAADTCTSLIVDQRLKGKYRDWAIVAAFGDNLYETATRIGLKAGLSENQLLKLKTLGVLLNYNGYGNNTDDLFFHPARLFEKLKSFKSPFEFLEQDKTTFTILSDGYRQDMEQAKQAPFVHEKQHSAVIVLPNKTWARRVSGVFGNELANLYPDRAHSIISVKNNGDYMVSVRAPLMRRYGADELVSQFPTGGGRKAAAGINNLPTEELTNFIKIFDAYYRQ
jgi:single-stranded DNA-specific DHH superfamily exonuclease